MKMNQTKRDFLKLCGVGAVALALPGLAGSRAAQSAGKPLNILFIITDQQHAGALSCTGNPHVKTPNLDRLAARGVRFEKSYCTYPLCCPSRASLFASRMPHELQIYDNSNAELAEKGVPTMGELFSAAGYETAYSGKWHLQVPFPAFRNPHIPGFTTLPLAGEDPHKVDGAKYGRGLTVDSHTADAAVQFLRQPHQKPFLLVASVLNPHDICEYTKCSAIQHLLPSDPAKLPPARPNLHATDHLPSGWQQFADLHADWTDHQWSEYLYAYYRLVEIADAEVGRVLAALDQAGLTSNTVVVFTADHGEMMGSHQMVTKQKLYDEAAAVPLIIAPPAAKPGVDAKHLASGLDILPTLLDYAGIAAPAALEGKSLRPLVEGKSVAWRDFVASECCTGGEARMIRTARYKYIAFPRGENRELFFDMEQDSGETKNLIAASAVADEVTRHRSLLKQWMQNTKDTFGVAPVGKKGKQNNTGGKKKTQAHDQST